MTQKRGCRIKDKNATTPFCVFKSFIPSFSPFARRKKKQKEELFPTPCDPFKKPREFLSPSETFIDLRRLLFLSLIYDVL